jgi:hypothetical protein
MSEILFYFHKPGSGLFVTAHWEGCCCDMFLGVSAHLARHSRFCATPWHCFLPGDTTNTIQERWGFPLSLCTTPCEWKGRGDTPPILELETRSTWLNQFHAAVVSVEANAHFPVLGWLDLKACLYAVNRIVRSCPRTPDVQVVAGVCID